MEKDTIKFNNWNRSCECDDCQELVNALYEAFAYGEDYNAFADNMREYLRVRVK